MPLEVTTTTISDIQAAFVTALEGLTPRHTRDQLQNWKYRQPRITPGMGTRWFHFEWDNDGITDGGFFYNGGASIDAQCSIVTDYNLPDHELDAIAMDDHWQVRDVLDALRINDAPGMRRVQ